MSTKPFRKNPKSRLVSKETKLRNRRGRAKSYVSHLRFLPLYYTILYNTAVTKYGAWWLLNFPSIPERERETEREIYTERLRD